MILHYLTDLMFCTQNYIINKQIHIINRITVIYFCNINIIFRLPIPCPDNEALKELLT